MYEFINNDLSNFTEEVNKYCGVIGSESEEELIPYNPIPQKIDALKGDLLARGNNYRIVLLTAKAIKSKNDELVKKIQDSVEQELAVAIEKQKAMLQGMSEQEAKEYEESLRQELTPADITRKNFSSESEILFNKLLQYTIISQDVTDKKLDTFVDMLAISALYIYPGWRNGRPYIKVCNSLNMMFDKNPNTPFIQHGDWVAHRDEITVADALQEYMNRLSDEDIEKLISYGKHFNTVTKSHIQEPVFDYNKYYSLLNVLGERTSKGIGLHQGTSLTNLNLHKALWRTHLEFKAFSEVMYVTMTDLYNEKITFTLAKKADLIPEDASKVTYMNQWGFESDKYIWTDDFGNEFEAELIWIPRRYEVTRLGESIFVDYREVPYQPDYTDNPFDRFELTYKGAILNGRNATSISRVMRAIPYAFQYMGVKRLQDREIAKYVGQEAVIDVDQIPDELAIDSETNPEEGEDRILRADIIARKTGKRFTSSSRNSNGLPPPPTRGAGVQYNIVDTSQQFINLQNFATMLNMELGMVMGVPPQREGMSVSNTNVTDNRQALMQSALATQTDFYLLDKVWSHVLNEHLYNLKTHIKMIFEQNPNLSNHQMEYILPDGTKELLSVTPAQLEQMEDIGLYLLDAGKEKLYFDFMSSPQIVQAFAQNAGEGVEIMSGLLKEMTKSNSVEETHKIISAEADRQRKRQEQIAEQQQKAQEAAQKYAQDLAKYQSDLELNKELQILAVKKELALEEAAIKAQQYANQYDINKDNINDQIEEGNRQRQFDAQENSKKLEVEREKIKSNEKIAILSKKNSSSK